MTFLCKLVPSALILVALPAAYRFGAASAAPSQDPVKVSPDVYKVALDNDRVRVLDITLKPGQKSPMHDHPDYVIYALSDGKGKFTDKAGKTQEIELKKGQAVWENAMSHAVENVGPAEIHVLNIELKEPKAKKAAEPAKK
jgi:quercetin dioxygenase-like cupin family protein